MNFFISLGGDQDWSRPKRMFFWFHYFLSWAVFKPQVGLRKTEESQKKGLKELTAFRENQLPALFAPNPHEAVKALELENMVQVAELYFKASMLRTESRDSHRNLDYPLRDNENWLKFINWQKDKNGKLVRSFETVPPIRS